MAEKGGWAASGVGLASGALWRPVLPGAQTWEPCPWGRGCPLDFSVPTVFTSLNSDNQSS